MLVPLIRILALLALLASVPSSAVILRGSGGTAAPPPPPSCVGAPFSTSCAAATWTADNNTTCTALYPFYWEIGNASGPIVADLYYTGNPVNQPPSNNPQLGAATAGTDMQYDSSSKWFTGIYVDQIRAGVLLTADIAALTQSDGDANSAQDTCPASDDLPTCLAILNTNVYNPSTAPNAPCPSTRYPAGNPNPQLNQGCNQPQSYTLSLSVGYFYYSGSHFMNELENNTTLSGAGVYRQNITAAYVAELTNGCACTLTGNTCGAPFTSGTQLPELCAAYQSNTFRFGGTNVAGQINSTAVAYRSVLKGILSHQLYAYLDLDTHLICTNPGGNYTNNPPGGANCNAVYGPITTVNQHYSIGHWVEDWYNSSSQYGDGAYSSPGAKGYYEWIDITQTYYGVVARVANNGGQGQITEKCAALIRNAFTCGVNQTTGFPVPCSPFAG